MKMVVGIRSERDAVALKSFLKAATGVTEVLVMAVIPKPGHLSTLVDYPARNWLHLSKLQDIERIHAAVMLAAFKEDIQRPNLKVETSVAMGAPAEELVKLARRSRADFIVITRRHGEQKESPCLGHVASRVARHAPCSVILLNPDRPLAERIVFATDGSPQAKKAGVQLRALGLSGSPMLFICTVAQTINPIFIRTGGHDYNDNQRILSEIHEQEKAAALHLLTSAAAHFKDAPFKIRQLAYEGDTSDIIMKVIREQQRAFLPPPSSSWEASP
jgi:nucleotide-binding universal stress UspA family protein